LKQESEETKGFLKTLLNSMASFNLRLLVNTAPLGGFMQTGAFSPSPGGL
jgi:hypothetical protein